MKALTIWQPWASLIMIGAKPYEFRRWDYRKRDRSLEGQRIVIHAGARRMRPLEVQDILLNLASEGEQGAGLKPEPARKLLVAVGFREGDGGIQLPHAHALGTAILGTPKLAHEIYTGDSDRIDQHIWAWPLTDIRHFEPPVPMRGGQGFWTYPEREAA